MKWRKANNNRRRKLRRHAPFRGGHGRSGLCDNFMRYLRDKEMLTKLDPLWPKGWGIDLASAPDRTAYWSPPA